MCPGTADAVPCTHPDFSGRVQHRSCLALDSTAPASGRRGVVGATGSDAAQQEWPVERPRQLPLPCSRRLTENSRRGDRNTSEEQRCTGVQPVRPYAPGGRRVGVGSPRPASGWMPPTETVRLAGAADISGRRGGRKGRDAHFAPMAREDQHAVDCFVRRKHKDATLMPGGPVFTSCRAVPARLGNIGGHVLTSGHGLRGAVRKPPANC